MPLYNLMADGKAGGELIPDGEVGDRDDWIAVWLEATIDPGVGETLETIISCHLRV